MSRCFWFLVITHLLGGVGYSAVRGGGSISDILTYSTGTYLFDLRFSPGRSCLFLITLVRSSTRRAKAYGKQANANYDDLTTAGSLGGISTTGESIGLDAIGMGWGGLSEATIERGSATTDGKKEAWI